MNSFNPYSTKKKKQTAKFTSAKFQKMFHPRYIIIKTERLNGKQVDPHEAAQFELFHLDPRHLQIQLLCSWQLIGTVSISTGRYSMHQLFATPVIPGPGKMQVLYALQSSSRCPTLWGSQLKTPARGNCSAVGNSIIASAILIGNQKQGRESHGFNDRFTEFRAGIRTKHVRK